MASFSHAVGAQTYRFDSLKDVMAKASPARSGTSSPVSPPRMTVSVWRRRWRWRISRSSTSCKKH